MVGRRSCGRGAEWVCAGVGGRGGRDKMKKRDGSEASAKQDGRINKR